MYLQGVDSIFDLVWTVGPDGQPVTYGDVFHQNEVEMSHFNFEEADVEFLFQCFDVHERESTRLMSRVAVAGLRYHAKACTHSTCSMPATRFLSLKGSAISCGVTAGAAVAQAYFDARLALGFLAGARNIAR